MGDLGLHLGVAAIGIAVLAAVIVIARKG